MGLSPLRPSTNSQGRHASLSLMQQIAIFDLTHGDELPILQSQPDPQISSTCLFHPHGGQARSATTGPVCAQPTPPFRQEET
jgi:hypothetical protein